MQNPTYKQRKAALIEEINTVFDGVSRENGVSLSEAPIIDNYGIMEERLEARKRDTETWWQDVPDEQLGGSGISVCFLDEIGFCYYVPAYMVWGLRYMGDYQSQIVWHLIISPQDEANDMLEYRLSRFSQFTLEQSKTIARFLQFEQAKWEETMPKKEELEPQQMKTEDFSDEEIEEYFSEYGFKNKESDAQKALNGYWGQFL